LISLKIIAKTFLYCTLLAKDAKIKFMLAIIQKRFFVSSDELLIKSNMLTAAGHVHLYFVKRSMSESMVMLP